MTYESQSNQDYINEGVFYSSTQADYSRIKKQWSIQKGCARGCPNCNGCR